MTKNISRGRKLLFCAVMAMLAGMQPASAQFDAAANGFDPDGKLITDPTQLSSPASDEAEGKNIEWLIDDNIQTFWHSDWHGKVQGEHYVQVDLPEETKGFYQLVFGRRNSSNTCQCTSMRVEESADGNTWTTAATLSLPWNGDQDQGTYVISDIFRLKGAGHLRLTSKSTNTGTATWHCAELQLYPANEEEALAEAINILLMQYDKYMPGYPEELSIGTAFGQYSDTEAWADFQADIMAAMDLAARLDGGETPPEAEVMAVVDKTEADYARLMASLVRFSMDEGYYRIVGNLPYYREVETGETDLDGNPVTERRYYDIAMLGTLEGWCQWDAKDDTDARQLWRLGMEGQDVRMVNAGTGMTCVRTVDNGDIQMEEGADKLFGFDYVGTQDGRDVVYIRFAEHQSGYDGTTSVYFHQRGHEKGAGKGPQRLCLWQATWNKGVAYTDDKGTSEWYLEPVGDEEAQQILEAYDLVKNHDKLVLGYQDYIAKARTALDMAYDLTYTHEADTDSPTITSTSQFHSLWTEPNEGSLDNLLDGDANTFWHSRWSGGKATGPHQASIDVSFDEPLSGVYQLYVLRRNTNNDHITRTSLYGTNDDNALYEEQDTNWELICDNVSTPWTDGQKDVYSTPFTVSKPYRHLRFYEEDANGKDNWHYTNCGHYATFQIYPSRKAMPSQFDCMGEAGTALAAIVDAYPAMDLEALTVDDYNALVKAYEDFTAILVNPQELRDAIAANGKYTDYVIVGEAPGFWTSDEPAAALESLLAEAGAYDRSGRYTQEQTDRYVTGIREARENIFGTALGVDPGKWYHLQFDTEENFDAYGWSKGTTFDGRLFGQRVAAGSRTDNIGTVLPSGDIVPGAALYYFDDTDVSNEEASQFRFVPLNDSTFAIQNRASGLYIHRNTLVESGGISLEWSPSAFTVKPIGYGQNILYMTDIDGTPVSKPHLNAWGADYSLVATWDDSHPGCNSHYLIAPVEDVDPDSYMPVMKLDRPVGGIVPLCYPADITTESSHMYVPVGCFDEDGGSYLALRNADGGVGAGVPFFLIPEGTYDGETAEAIELYPGSGMTSEPGSAGGLVGVFKDTWIGTGYVTFSGNEAKGVEGKDTGRNYCVPANTAYLRYGDVMLPEGEEYDIAIQVNGKFDDWTGIGGALDNVAREGAVYTLSGRLVSRKATLGDIRKMGRGIYIINGTKVLVR